MKNFKTLKKELLAEPEIKKEYDALDPEYQLIRAVIAKRIQKNMSQAQLAKKVGTKQSAISRFESGNANPSLKFLQKVAKGLGSELKVKLH